MFLKAWGNRESGSVSVDKDLNGIIRYSFRSNKTDEIFHIEYDVVVGSLWLVYGLIDFEDFDVSNQNDMDVLFSLIDEIEIELN